MMGERDWEKFFELMDKIVKSCTREGVTWQEMKAKVIEEADRSQADLEEFIGWFDGEME